MLILLVLITVGIWGFAELADEVIEGETHSFDEAVLLAMRNPADPADPFGPYWLEELFRDFTALGGVGVLVFITLAVAGFLMLRGHSRATILILAAICGGLLLSSMLKYGIDRPRPDLVPHGSYVYTASFPSGHSMMSAVTYLTLGALLAKVHKRRRDKSYFILLAIFLTVLVGISRIYLGVHWPTDVLGGWAVGASWALICWLAARWLQNRGQVGHDVEQSSEPRS
jgi:undecaprenyl-diphosphatase